MERNPQMPPIASVDIFSSASSRFRGFSLLEVIPAHEYGSEVLLGLKCAKNVH